MRKGKNISPNLQVAKIPHCSFGKFSEIQTKLRIDRTNKTT
jgi:hypothetical protein